MTDKELMQRSLNELAMQVQKHQQLVNSVMEGCSLPQGCVWNDCHHQQTLLNLIVETVQVLDETRKSFKSKQLEQLRKRLLAVLKQETECCSHNEFVQLAQ